MTRIVSTKPYEIRNVNRYRIPSPHGEVLFAAPEKSVTVQRVMGLCEIGALQEFVKVYQRGLMHHCHDAAFEFAYAITASLSRSSIGLRQQDLGVWRWCMGGRKIDGHDDVHSWIEQDDDDEAFDVVRDLMLEGDSMLVYVRPRRRLYKEYGVTNVESRSLYHFVQWLASPHESRLFARYPTVSDQFSQNKTKITVVRV